ncbi:MAG: phosphoribosyl 1,2-cyclic phosphodiesterase [Myxococcota bacterium]|jgi:phosphoribosyl 1,2-cyclic phosphodiesterase
MRPTTVTFWGVRGSIPTPGRSTRKYGGNTSCIEIDMNEALIICDAGTGARELGLDLVGRTSDPMVAHMFFSHAHWDHIQGFPFFVPAYSPANEVRVYGTQPGDERFYNLISGQMGDAYFPVKFSDLGAKMISDDIGEGVVAGVKVRWLAQTHPGGSFGYSFEFDGVRVVYATDNELDLQLADQDLPTRDPEALRILPDRQVDFVRNADLLIADSQYTDEEYVTKVGWGHPRYTTVVDLAVQGNVKKLALTHHDPLHSDADLDKKVEHAAARARSHGSNVQVFGAREGVQLLLP